MALIDCSVCHAPESHTDYGDQWRCDNCKTRILKSTVDSLGLRRSLIDHPMFQGEGSIPKANVRFVLMTALNQEQAP